MKTTQFRCLRILPALLVSLAAASTGTRGSALAASADLWQARNGTPESPKSPVEWVKGNAGSANSHYIEGHSIPYRMVMTGLTNGPHTLVIEWDTRLNGKHAIDYITHYERLVPHTWFGDHVLAESINPLEGIEKSFGSPQVFPIPNPSTAGSPMFGQPAASFESLPLAERIMTVWNGTISRLVYLREDPLSGDTASTRLAIEFTATEETAIIAWGGHIGTKLDWGSGNSAINIGGSPYHMRKIELDGVGGNQDRSVQALAVSSPPSCVVTGLSLACAATIQTYAVMTDSTDPKTSYHWSLTDNTAGASIVSATNRATVEVATGSAGSYSLRVVVQSGYASSNCSYLVTVTPSTSISPLADQTVCPGSDVTLSTVPGGTGPFTYVWRKDGQVIPNATNTSLILENIRLADTGRFCAEVLGVCGSAVTCANVTVQPPPVLAGPPDITRECLADVPPPDPGSVLVISGTDPVTVTHAGDVLQTNGCAILVLRTYQALDSCASLTVWHQTISVMDTTPPVITCVPNRVVECGAAWDFGVPTAVDICDGNDVTIAITGTVTNALPGNLLRAIRTWMASDACGNVATCSQTITVMDSTAPEIVCAANAVVHCEGPEGATASFQVTATDVCDAEVQVICVPPSGSVFPLGNTVVQCSATDINGNRGTCSFTVAVIDLVPPSIACPADIFMVEDPPDSGHVPVQFPAPLVSDNHDLNPAIVCSPSSSSTFPVGDTQVFCVVTDGSGNTNACSFQVRVVPRVIVANNTADSGPGTLRQALLDANAAAGFNVVAFAFPGSPPYVIHLLSPLPPIVDPVTIDGWSQLAFQAQPVIELDGSNVVTSGADTTGLTLLAGGTEVRGLILNGFNVGLLVAGPGQNVIQGNFVGFDPSNGAAPGNTGDGVQILSSGNLIGGDTPAARNIISGNHGNGVVLDGSNTVENVVRGNWIGTTDGSSLLGNGRNGVVIRNGAANNRVGPDNVIAFNELNGILLEGSAGIGNAIRGNAIFANGALGIDSGGDGGTPNDDGDADGGPNQLQNFPLITNARLGGGMTVIEGTLYSTASNVFHLDFFASSTLEPDGSAQAKRFLGSATVTTDGSGRADFLVTLPVSVSADEFITATATDFGNNTSELSAPAKVGGPPVIVVPPVGTAVLPGASVSFCVTATGSQPLTYQWRLNGANIPDATNECFAIQSAILTSGGSYTVVVANEYGVVTSDPAVLRLILPAVPAGDNFVDRVRLTNNTGLVSWNNIAATREVGEPNHAGKPGSKSVWYTWTAPATGVATFSAVGSAFDTLLAVYVGETINTLALVGSDEDQGGFFTSILRFNAIAGTKYQIAIDGFGNEFGEIVLDWHFEATNRLLPVIFYPPVSQTVVSGSTALFMVDASADCREPHYNCRRVSKDQPVEPPGNRDPLLYQWFFNGVAIVGATKSSLTLSNVQEGAVGSYSVEVTSDGGTVATPPVRLQLNDTGSIAQNVQARDKFLDAAIAPPLRLGTPSLFTATADAGVSSDPTFVPAVIVRSYTSTQVFSSAGSTTSAGELLPCYGVGGASDWYAIVAEETGVLHVNTDGSSYDTVLAVYTYSPTSAGLIQLGCDNNSGIDKKDSAVNVPVQAGQTNFVVIDGYNGAFGVASLHFSLLTQGSLQPLQLTAQRAFQLRLSGPPAMRFTIQASSNLVNWTSIVTNNSATGTFDYTDSRSTNAPRRFYRALMLP